MKVNRKKEKEIDHLVEEYFRYDQQTGKIYNNINRRKVTINKEVGSVCSDGYFQIKLYKKVFKFHRVAWRLHYGKWPKNKIDHINGDKSDNRICNLREVTNRENQQNLKKHRNGSLLGSSFNKKTKKYSSQIGINKKQFYLGYFKTELEAHEQYLRALKAIEKRNFKSAKELRDYLKKV